MRTRAGNLYNEPHGLDCHNHDWIAPPGTDPAQLPALLEAAVPGLNLEPSRGLAHGFISTSLRPDGSLYVCLSLYGFSCAGERCSNLHAGITLTQAPVLTLDQGAALERATGAHTLNLDGTGADVARLRALGFTDADTPLRPGKEITQ